MLPRPVNQRAGILTITDPDGDGAGIEAHASRTFVFDMAEQHYCVIGREPVNFVDGDYHIAVIADV